MDSHLSDRLAGAARPHRDIPPDRWPGTFVLPERPAPVAPPPAPGALALTALRARMRDRDIALLAQRSWLIGCLLYGVALLPLLVKLAGYPAVAFNWEEYSARDILTFLDAPTLTHFAPTDGLMTDSGHSPLIALPVVLAWRLGGIGLLGLRLPIALLAAGAVPLCWLLGRRIIGAGPALFGAFLLAASPVFVLYGRTATLVGLSLVPALATAIVLRHLLARPTLLRLGLLQLALLGLGWAYGPIRFLWPIAVAALAAEVVLRRGLRWRFAVAMLVTATALPLFLWGVARWQTPAGEPAPGPVVALRGYYNGRGEHALADEGGLARARELIAKNAVDSRDLLLDRDTSPVVLDYWNPHGRLHEGWLVPFLAVGLAWTLWRARRDPGARLLLLALAGFWLPLLLTSNVHVGRLIYVVPLLALLTARGAATLATLVGWLVARWLTLSRVARPASPALAAVLRAAGAVLIVLAVGWRGWQDYTVEVPLGNMARGVALLDANATASAGSGRKTILFLTLSEPQSEGNTALTPEDPAGEALGVAAYRLRLDRAYRTVNLAAERERWALDDLADARPVLLYGGNPAAALNLGQLCAATYFAPTDIAPALAARTAALACPAPPVVLALPR